MKMYNLIYNKMLRGLIALWCLSISRSKIFTVGITSEAICLVPRVAKLSPAGIAVHVLNGSRTLGFVHFLYFGRRICLLTRLDGSCNNVLLPRYSLCDKPVKKTIQMLLSTLKRFSRWAGFRVALVVKKCSWRS